MYKKTNQMQFFSEMTDKQISAREFFSVDFLKYLVENFNFNNVSIMYFDTHGNFLSWITKSGLYVNCDMHPYSKFYINDVVRHKIYQDAVRDHLTYFNMCPRLYKSTDIIAPIEYNSSSYVHFLEANFNAHYSVNLAFGMNAYIQIIFFKTFQEGDFNNEEIEDINEIYIFISTLYKNFKKHEQRKIVALLQNKIIEAGEKAFIITDDFMHVLSYNDSAKSHLIDIFGEQLIEPIDSEDCNPWLSLITGFITDCKSTFPAKIIIKNYTFKIHVYDQDYSHKIIDRYYWITISSCAELNSQVEYNNRINSILTKTEFKVALLICQGLTYKNIAKELFVSYHTIKKHVQNIYKKCDVTSRYELYAWLKNQNQ